MPLYSEHAMRQEDALPRIISGGATATYNLTPVDKAVLVTNTGGGAVVFTLTLPSITDVPDDAPYVCIFLVSTGGGTVAISTLDVLRLPAIAALTLTTNGDFAIFKKTPMGWIRVQQKVGGVVTPD